MVPLVCALFALSGIASARAGGARLAAPEGLVKIALCLPSGQPADSPQHDHDCDSCCLVVPVALVPPQAFALLAPAIAGALAPNGEVLPVYSGPRLLPWSRGPPAAV